MPTYTLYVVDLVAICVLVFGLFLPRHQRPELIVAFLTVNIGVLAVTSALSSSTVGAGLGLGPVRDPLDHPVAVGGADPGRGRLLLRGARPRTPRRAGGLRTRGDPDGRRPGGGCGRRQPEGRAPGGLRQLLDRAHVVQSDLVAHLESLLGAAVVSAKVLRTDLVNDTTLVDVRYRPDACGARPATCPPRRCSMTALAIGDTDLEPIGLDELVERAELLLGSTASTSSPCARPVTDGCRAGGHAGAGDRRRRSFGYRSAYLDTPDLHSLPRRRPFHRRRWKVRTRTYLDAAPDATSTWLEVRLAAADQTLKQRIAHPNAELTAASPRRGAFVGAIIGDTTRPRSGRCWPRRTSAARSSCLRRPAG